MPVSAAIARWFLLAAAVPVGLLAGLHCGRCCAAEAAAGEEPSALAAVAVIEQAMVSAIARAEKSLAAIARVRRDDGRRPVQTRPDPFARRISPLAQPQPTDPDFVPNEYASGVVVDAAGLILTAAHVLGPDSDYYVTTNDRKVYKASVKAADPRSDLAVLAIEARGLTPITFGDGAALRKGQIVIALGNPYAIARDGQPSAAWGIVSNVHRKAPPWPDPADPTGKPTLHHFGTLIQTDARLNVGTSGGALVNLRGEMVGLIVAPPAAAGYESAAGYAIPVDSTFRRALEQLKQGREVEYGFLGVQPLNLSAQQRLEGVFGARVERIVQGTPAARAGLRPDDIITAVNGKPIYEADGLVLEVGRLPVQSTARLAVLRGGKQRELTVTLGKYPVRGLRIVTAPAPAWRGMRVDYPTVLLDGQLRPHSGASGLEEGAAVIEVVPGSAAWNAGLRTGMVITHVGRTAIDGPAQFHQAVAALRGPVQLRLVGTPPTTVTIGEDESKP